MIMPSTENNLGTQMVALISQIAAEQRPAEAGSLAVNAQLERFVLDLKREFSALTSPWLNRDQAAAYLQVSTSTLDNMRGKGALKTYWLGDTPRFKRSELDGLMKEKQ